MFIINAATILFYFCITNIHAGLPANYPSIPIRAAVRMPYTIRMPLIGSGTWLYNDSQAQFSVETAFKLGYRHVDTALTYHNQLGVGKALQNSGLPREEYFITSKIPGAVNESSVATLDNLNECLALLNQSYVDLMLIHWPGKTTTKKGRQIQWLTLEKWAKAGKAKAIGISHYCQTHVEEILEVATLPIALNQNQYHVGMGQDDAAQLHDKKYMESQGIVFMAYSTLCGPCAPPLNHELINGALVESIGKPLNKTGAQIALKWAVQQGIPVIPKSSNPAHIRSNFDLFGWEIEKEDMARLSSAVSPPETGTTQNPDDAQDCQA